MAEQNYCNDYGDAPDCLKDIDPKYTMDFTNINKGYIYWCTKCGTKAQIISGLLTEAMNTQKGFTEKFRELVDKAHETQTKH